MKQSVYTKNYTASGKNGTFDAQIVVTMNYDTKKISGTHSATHDDHDKLVPVHKVEVFINGQLWVKSYEIQTQEAVLSITDDFKKEAISRINVLASQSPTKTFIESLNEILS